MLGATGKMELESAAVVTEALGCRGPPSSPFREHPQMCLNVKGRRHTVELVREGESGIVLLISQSIPDVGKKSGKEGFGGRADRASYVSV